MLLLTRFSQGDALVSWQKSRSLIADPGAVLLRRVQDSKGGHQVSFVRASCKERGHHGFVAILSRDVQRRRAFLRRRVRVRASGKELGHHGFVTVLSREVQRRPAVLRRRVLVRASCKVRAHHGLVTVSSCDVQWRYTVMHRRCKEHAHHGHHD